MPHPLPWYIAGPLIGLIVPALLLAGNKAFGISSNFRHICGAVAPCGLAPHDIFAWTSLLTLRGFICIVAGGFLVGFGTAYAGGLATTYFILPRIL